MLKLSDENVLFLRQAVRQAQNHPELPGKIHTLYADVSHQIDRRQPRCDVSGRCCRFDEYGHRLFVTTAEIAVFVCDSTRSATVQNQSENHSASLPLFHEVKPPHSQIAAGRCPYQIEKLCSVHTIRPFGCRIFFCDPAAQDWQQAQYEIFHLRLRELHEELHIPYLYVDWLEALKAVQMPAE